MVVLIPAVSVHNEYVELLAAAYRRAGWEPVIGPEHLYDGDVAADLVHVQWPEALYAWGFKQPLTEETLCRTEERLTRFREGNRSYADKDTQP